MRTVIRFLAMLAAFCSTSAALAQGGPDPLDAATRALGSEVYASSCAACHDNAGTHAPSVMALGGLSPERVLRVLESGRMQAQAAALSDEERAAVAQVIANRPLGLAAQTPPLFRCEGEAAQFDHGSTPSFVGWGLDAGNAHAIPTEVAGMTAADAERLTLRWAFAFPETVETRSQPTIAGGAIYVGGGDGTLYALDLDTGCTRWTYQAASSVRSGVVVSPWDAGDSEARPLVFFGDSLGYAYALDAVTGAEVWARRVEGHGFALLTGTPALHGDTLFVPVSSGEEGSAAIPTYECCTFRGSLIALDAMTGETRWQTFMVGEPHVNGATEIGTPTLGPSGVAIWSAPLVDAARETVYVATGDNYTQPATHLSDAIVAMDITTGAIRWATQVTPGDAWNVACWPNPAGTVGANCPEDAGPDADFGAAPVMARGADGRDYLLAGQKSGVAYAFDPDTGELLWEHRVGRGGVLGGVHFGIAADSGRLYVPINDGPTDPETDHPRSPGVYALDVATGEPVWSAPSPDVCAGRMFCEPGYTAAITATPDMVVAGAADGHVRILSAETGEVLWDFNTAREFTSVNGATGNGGSMSGGAAPVIYDGNLIVSSGYAFLGKMPGNMLLVFGTE